MCVFQSGKDIPPLVRLALRTLQYFVIPLLSLAILFVGAFHYGQCAAQPNLPLWHVIAGASGLCTPFLYLIFDEVNPTLSRRFPGVSEFLDNIVIFLLPLYIVFEVSWLIVGTVWVFGSAGVSDPDLCDHTVYIFSAVVVLNFWVHLLTPLVFMFGLCCTRIFPYCAYCGYWNFLKTAMDNWTRRTRMLICACVAVPLGASMVATGAISMRTSCDLTSNLASPDDDNALEISDDSLNSSSSDIITQPHFLHWDC